MSRETRTVSDGIGCRQKCLDTANVFVTNEIGGNWMQLLHWGNQMRFLFGVFFLLGLQTASSFSYGQVTLRAEDIRGKDKLRFSAYMKFGGEYYGISELRREAFAGGTQRSSIGESLFHRTVNPNLATKLAIDSILTDPLVRGSKRKKHGGSTRKELHSNYDPHIVDSMVVQHLLGTGHLDLAVEWMGLEIAAKDRDAVGRLYNEGLKEIVESTGRDRALLNAHVLTDDVRKRIVAAWPARSRHEGELGYLIGSWSSSPNATRTLQAAVAIDAKVFPTTETKRDAMKVEWLKLIDDDMVEEIVDTATLFEEMEWIEWEKEGVFSGVLEQLDVLFTADEKTQLRQTTIMLGFARSSEDGLRMLDAFDVDYGTLRVLSFSRTARTLEHIRAVSAMAPALVAAIGAEQAKSLLKPKFIPFREHADTNKTRLADAIVRGLKTDVRIGRDQMTTKIKNRKKKPPK